MYNLLISDESRLDILDAFSWYESRREGLGAEFEICLDAGFKFVQKNPLLSQRRYKNLRIYFIERFPYGIHYFIDGNSIKVLGIFHTSRNPKNWSDRLNG
jgi:toxin ParE1/3/4